MGTIDVVRRMLGFADGLSRPSFEDMRDAAMTPPTVRGGNHPLWVIGHVAYAESAMLAMVRGGANPLSHWEALFGSGSEPSSDASRYPSFDEVLEAYSQARVRTLAALDELGESGLGETPSGVPEEMREAARTNADVLMLIAMHQEFHRGQVADARRAAGRGPLFESSAESAHS